MKDAGHEVDVTLGLSPEELIATIPAYDALIVRSATQATREVIEAGVNLKVIGRAGVGVDNVDVTAATERGVIVCNAPTSNVVSAAEQTMALMLAISRRTAQANASMQEHRWDRGLFTGNELFEKTLAIFGLGRIGGLITERAKSFGMEVIGYDPYCSPERAAKLGVTLYEDINDILPLADYITVHLPKTPETIGMFGPEQFAMMKDGVYVINTARGGIYNIDALAEAVKSGKVAGAGIDVYEKEPCTESVLHGVDGIVLTPHLGASTKEAQARAGVQTAEFVLMGLAGKMPPTAVNVSQVPEDVMQAVAPFIDAATLCGEVLSQMADEAISKLTVRVSGKIAMYDVSVLGTAALKGIFAKSSDDPVNLVNASFIAEQRGVEITIDKDAEHYEYANVVTLIGHFGTKDIEISCTTSGPEGKTRIVSILDYKLDLIPGNYFMVLKYADKPGQIGKIGTVLGNANINISTMEVGVSNDRDGIALILMNVDSPVAQSVRKKLCDTAGVEAAWFIEL
jgi:D-3-phosphoglycerate dehydrogenase